MARKPGSKESVSESTGRASTGRRSTGRRSTGRRSTGRRAAPSRTGGRVPKTPEGLPELVFAQASPHSVGGRSLFDVQAPVDSSTATGFTSEPQLTSSGVQRLREAGFEILHASPISINIAGPASLYEEAFGTTLVAEERPVVKELGREDTATFVECPDTDVPGLIDPSGTDFAGVLEGIALEEPRYFFSDPFPPVESYWHLRVPGDVSLACNADKAHRGGITGRGTRVVMTDSGWFEHPYFKRRGYRYSRVVLGPGARRRERDEIGHGTAESANIFAVAPDVRFTMVKMSFVNTVGAFNRAVELDPDVISNSWGSDVRRGSLSAADRALAAAIGLAVDDGIVVVFSAGNGHFGFPGQHPDVISAGGVFMQPDGDLRASDYASGFASEIYEGRDVPDVCGLVGMLPSGVYIMLPVEPGDAIDVDLASRGRFPKGDQTAPDDGWAAISGTSAAAPQLAGACALLRQAHPGVTPQRIRRILQRTARDVTAGTGNPRTGGHRAKQGDDLATGAGLVDAHRAVLVAKVQAAGTSEIAGVAPAVPAGVPARAAAAGRPPAGRGRRRRASRPGASRPARLSGEEVSDLEELIEGSEDFDELIGGPEDL